MQAGVQGRSWPRADRLRRATWAAAPATLRGHKLPTKPGNLFPKHLSCLSLTNLGLGGQAISAQVTSQGYGVEGHGCGFGGGGGLEYREAQRASGPSKSSEGASQEWCNSPEVSVICSEPLKQTKPSGDVIQTAALQLQP